MRTLGASILRRVWAVVTVNPAASARQIAVHLGTGYDYSDIALALRALVQAGYIGEPPARCAPRPIFLPFVVDSERTSPILSAPTAVVERPSTHKRTIRLDECAYAAVEAARRGRETDEAVINRVLAAVLPVAAELDDL